MLLHVYGQPLSNELCTCSVINVDHFLFSLEGQLTSLQAYQTLRNCGTDLIYESPEKRIELAHYFWDRILQLGKYMYDDTVTGHHLYSVFIYIFFILLVQIGGGGVCLSYLWGGSKGTVVLVSLGLFSVKTYKVGTFVVQYLSAC